jgi:hypothetical protein
VTDPTKGGKIELLLDGTEAHQMFDNITVDADGNTTCRRMSATPHVTVRFGSTTRIPARLRNLFQHDPARFGDLTIPPTPPFNLDEESSGIPSLTAASRRATPGHQREGDLDDGGI